MNAELYESLPQQPDFSAELVEECKRTRDFRPILFEWYKYVGKICNVIACVDSRSPALRPLPGVQFAVLIGLLNRCSRLMIANIRLSCTRRYGETTRLIDRSIAETAIKIQWLCQEDDPERFVRFVADALKKDILLKDHIEQNIKNRGGDPLVIESRMLDSIRHCIERGGICESDVRNAKKLPDFASMCRILGFDEQFYLVIQRIGSHAVHGTWSDLLFNYLRFEDGTGFHPRDHDVETQDVQYLFICKLALDACKSFLHHVCQDTSDTTGFISLAEGVQAALVKIQGQAWGPDFGNAADAI